MLDLLQIAAVQSQLATVKEGDEKVRSKTTEVRDEAKRKIDKLQELSIGPLELPQRFALYWVHPRSVWPTVTCAGRANLLHCVPGREVPVAGGAGRMCGVRGGPVLSNIRSAIMDSRELIDGGRQRKPREN